MSNTETQEAPRPSVLSRALSLSLVRDAWRRRELLRVLTSRELSARYRGSALGFLWSLANPLLLLAVYTLVFGTILAPKLGESSSKDPYALYLITGLFPWIWTVTSLLEGSVSLSANSGLIRKAVFPCELLPLVSVVSNLVHFIFALPILLGALLVGRLMGFPVLGWGSLSAVGIVVLQFLALSGAALGLSAACVHFKDIRDLLANALQLLFFLAPILYEVSDIGLSSVQLVIRLNPFTPFALAYQSTLFRGDVPSLAVWLQMSSVSVVFFVLGTTLFRRLEDTLVEAV